MRRWILWTGLAVVLGVALVFGLTQIPGTTPYRFLRGWKTVPVDEGGGRLRPPRPEDRMRIYTIKGDFDKAVAEASRELKAQGMREIRDPYGITFLPAEGSFPKVSFGEDMKVSELTVTNRGILIPVPGAHDGTGWVSVFVEGDRTSSWWDNFCGWLGF